ncbi:MAG: LysR substrate-binding domain-containing protein [Cytophagaceae bacterium]|jgi:LysR family hydrogen peroxide-inducible transcriptional activator|nr:LysR substrate-binding domain-containing protein [Cytophagaceae bacterium]
MTLQQLEYIIALDNHRNFVKAAESCYVTQPTLTMLVQKLEEEIGIKLFDRNTKPVQPTPAGIEIIKRARIILREVNELKAFVRNEQEQLEGSFTLGVIPTLAPYLIPLFIKQFVKSFPDTHLQIKEMQTEQINEGLLKGTLDLGLLATPLDIQYLREIPLFQEPLVLYLPEKHELQSRKEITQSQLDLNEMLMLEVGHCLREQTLSICSAKKKARNNGFEYEVGSLETIKELVKQGIGYSLVPELSILKETNAKHLKRLKSPEPAREISLVVHQNFTREVLIEKLHACILQSVPKQFKQSIKTKKIRWR